MKSRTISLMYHDIIGHDVAESGFQNKTALKYKVTASAFEEQVKQIRKYLDLKKLPDSAVSFTFDDGGESFLIHAAPILEKYGFKGVFFISTGYIGNKGFLDANQIRALIERGHVVGSHSHSHPERMSVLSSKEIHYEWNISQLMLNEILGYKPQMASIPNGYSSEEIINSITSAGIHDVYTSQPTSKTKNMGNCTLIGRYAVTTDMSTDDVLSIVISPYKRYKIECRQQILDLAKKLLGNYYLSIRKKLIK